MWKRTHIASTQHHIRPNPHLTESHYRGLTCMKGLIITHSYFRFDQLKSSQLSNHTVPRMKKPECLRR